MNQTQTTSGRPVEWDGRVIKKGAPVTSTQEQNTAATPCDAVTRPGAFVQVPAAVLALSGNAVKLYAILARHAGPDGRCWPGQHHLEADTGWSTSTVRRTTRELQQAGVLEVLQRSTTPGTGPTNVYTVGVRRRAVEPASAAVDNHRSARRSTGHQRPVAPVTADRQNDTQGTTEPPNPPPAEPRGGDVVAELGKMLPPKIGRRLGRERHHGKLRHQLEQALQHRTLTQLYRQLTGNAFGDLAAADSVTGALAWRLGQLEAELAKPPACAVTDDDRQALLELHREYGLVDA